MHIIDYGHIREGVLYHGTLSDLDGTVKATWTYEEGGQKVTRDRPMDAETFSFLWNGLASWDVFRRCMAGGPETPIDPRSHHVIGIIFQQGGQQGQCVFLVPAGETDADFVRWLAALNVPGDNS